MKSLFRTHAVLLFSGIVTFMLMGAGQSLYGPALPAFAREFGLTVADAGWLVSALWCGSATGVAIMFWRGQGITPRHALAILALGAAGIAAGLGWWATVGFSVLFGTGYGLSTVVFNPRVLRAFGAKGPSMVGLLNATFAAGAIAMPLVFVRVGSDPQISFALVAAICAVTWLFAGSSGRVDEEVSGAIEPYRFRPLILCFAVIGIATEACLIGLGPTALIKAGVSETIAAEALSGFFVAFLASRSALVFLAHRFAAFTILAVAMAVAACSALSATVLPPIPFFVMLGGATGLFFPNCYVEACRQMGTNPRVTPTIIAAGLVGGISAPVLLGQVLGGMGERGFFQIVGGVCLVTALAAFGLRARMAAKG